MRDTLVAGALVAALIGSGTTIAAPRDFTPMTRDQEIALVVSAAPEHLRAGVGVWVFGEAGYEQVRPSSNGFDCLVQFGRPPSEMLSPICYDREGAETLMQRDLLSARLRVEGRSDEEITQAIRDGYANGSLLAPRKPGVAYMMSTEFSRKTASGEREAFFPPHIMFYAPYGRNEDFGFNPAHAGTTDGPWILGQGQPGAYIIVTPPGVVHADH